MLLVINNKSVPTYLKSFYFQIIAFLIYIFEYSQEERYTDKRKQG